VPDFSRVGGVRFIDLGGAVPCQQSADGFAYQLGVGCVSVDPTGLI
jgi:hypothetical protein